MRQASITKEKTRRFGHQHTRMYPIPSVQNHPTCLKLRGSPAFPDPETPALNTPLAGVPGRRARKRAASALNLSASARKRSSSFRRRSLPAASLFTTALRDPFSVVPVGGDGLGISRCRLVAVSGYGDASAGSPGLRQWKKGGGLE